jgi:hypothetical protein
MTHANVLELGRSAQMRRDLRAPQPADHQPMTSAACVLAYLGAAPLIAALPLFGSGDATIKIVIVMVLMIALLCDDLAATRRGSGAPQWYLCVRVPLTVLIEVAFLVALAAGARA